MRLKTTLKLLVHYKSFVAGVIIVFLFVGLAVYAAVTWPYEEAVKMWNDPKHWEESPRTAAPAWITVFTGRTEIVGTLAFDTRDVRQIDRYITIQTITRGGVRFTQINITIPFNYDVFPSDVALKLYPSIAPGAEITSVIVRTIRWEKPNGIAFMLYSGSIKLGEEFQVPLEKPGEVTVALGNYAMAVRKMFNFTFTEEALKNLKISSAMFQDDAHYVKTNETIPLKGEYKLVVEYTHVEGLESIDVRFLVYGTVYGLLGTDKGGRDLFMGIAWGTPVALAFGLLASLLTTLTIMIMSALSAWFRGPVDLAVSRINEIFMILPFLPTVIMISLFYGYTLWTLLGIVVLLSSLGSGALKSQRAMFYQIREMPYIEAARAYGAGSFRIVFRYMIPRVLPIIIPGIITSVPSFVFLEAALAILGIADPLMITWGKILQESYRNAALIGGALHWVFAPSAALFMMSISFALIGFTLDRVFNPRLRQL